MGECVSSRKRGLVPGAGAMRVALLVVGVASGCAIGTVIGAAIGAGPARADMIIPDPRGSKRVPARITIDWGPWRKLVSTRIVVAKGDTLARIARRAYGDADRWVEIRDANPHVRLGAVDVRAGEVLWLPPVAAIENQSRMPAERQPLYEAFWLRISPRMEPAVAVERATPGEIPEEYRSGGSLAFVPVSQAATLIEDLGHGAFKSASPRSWEGSQFVHFHPDTLLSEDDPAVRVVCRFRVAGVQRDPKTGRLPVEVERLRLDAKHRLVTTEYEVPEPVWGFGVDDLDDLDELDDEDETRRRREREKSEIRRKQAKERWPDETGGMIAIGGLLAVLGVAIARRREEGAA